MDLFLHKKYLGPLDPRGEAAANSVVGVDMVDLRIVQQPANNWIGLARLGKHKLGKGCLYVRRLDDVDETVLAQLVSASVTNARASG